MLHGAIIMADGQFVNICCKALIWHKLESAGVLLSSLIVLLENENEF